MTPTYEGFYQIHTFGNDTTYMYGLTHRRVGVDLHAAIQREAARRFVAAMKGL